MPSRWPQTTRKRVARPAQGAGDGRPVTTWLAGSDRAGRRTRRPAGRTTQAAQFSQPDSERWEDVSRASGARHKCPTSATRALVRSNTETSAPHGAHPLKGNTMKNQCDEHACEHAATPAARGGPCPNAEQQNQRQHRTAPRARHRTHKEATT